MRAFTCLRLRLLEAALRALSVRRLRILAWRAMLGADVQGLTFVRDGIVWTAQGSDDIVFHLFVDGSFHGEEIAALIDWMRYFQLISETRDALVDIGANIGSTCIPFVRRTECRALAIEPVAENFRSLTFNVLANGLGERIRLAQRAVMHAPGIHTMWLTGTMAGGNFVRREGVTALPPTVTGQEEVEADTLSGIVGAAGLSAEEIALVWADVQGCEVEVIESGACFWAAGVPLWAEVEPISLARQGHLATFSEVAALHFDRFITAGDLKRARQKAPARPIAELQSVIRGIRPEQVNIDVLFLPPSCAARPPIDRNAA